MGVWAVELGLHPDDLHAALRELAASELVFLDPTGRGITGAVPFAAGTTAHQVAIAGGPTVSANCALDALGMAAMLDRDIDIQSTDPLTGEQVTATSRDGGWTWYPAAAVVFVGSTGMGRITETCCPAINFSPPPRTHARTRASTASADLCSRCPTPPTPGPCSSPTC